MGIKWQTNSILCSMAARCRYIQARCSPMSPTATAPRVISPVLLRQSNSMAYGINRFDRTGSFTAPSCRRIDFATRIFISIRSCWTPPSLQCLKAQHKEKINIFIQLSSTFLPLFSLRYVCMLCNMIVWFGPYSFALYIWIWICKCGAYISPAYVFNLIFR